MTNLQIIFSVIVVSLSIIFPLYYSYKKRAEENRINEQIKESKYVSEKEKIRVYLNNINQKTRDKFKNRK
tara:strand:+ start:845 stop:1054 length:210 start_codon:yes stop_codon:yes gene_type:complete